MEKDLEQSLASGTVHSARTERQLSSMDEKSLQELADAGQGEISELADVELRRRRGEEV
jgi:hypothetical protein